MTYRSFLGMGMALVLCAWAACSSDSSNESADRGAASTSSSGAGASGASTSSDGGAGGFTGTGGSGASGGLGGGCASRTVIAEKVPLDIFIMQDRSGSMLNEAGPGTRWSATVEALKSFVDSPQVTGIGVGIGFFPQPSGYQCPGTPCSNDDECGEGCGPCVQFDQNTKLCQGHLDNNDSCDAADYATPAAPIGALPANAAAIKGQIDATSPSQTGGTPTYPSLQGAIDYAKTWATQHPDHTTVVAYVTDGDPTSCDKDLDHIYALAAAGLNGQPSIRTYVIGVGPFIAALNGIAQHGGTNEPYLVDSDAQASDKLVQALLDIQGQALGCVYTIPTPGPGEEPDFDSVNVQYTPGGNGMAEIFPKVLDEAHCPPGGDAWYYDDNASPKQIILCDETCTKLSADHSGQIDIVLGCETVIE